MDIEELAKRRNETPQEVMMGGVNNDYNAIINLINQAINDPNIITKKQKDILKTGFKDYVMPPVDGSGLDQAIWGISQVAPELKALGPLKGIVGGATVGSILPLKKFLDTFEEGSGVVNKIVKNSDKSVKHVLTDDDAVDYYLNSIKHLDKTTYRSGREAYVNPLDSGNHYNGDWKNPDAKMFASYASNSQGNGKFNDILTGIFLDNGLYKPTSISRVDVVNRPTVEALGNGTPVKDTLLGHSSDVIAKNLGGVLGDFEITPGQFNDDLLMAIRRGVDPSNFEQMKKYYGSLSYFDRPTHLHKMFKNATLKAPVKFKK